MDEHMRNYLLRILLISISPLAFLIWILMALFGLLRFFYKAMLLFIIVAINTPFEVMSTASVQVFYHILVPFLNPSGEGWDYLDPRVSVGIEVQLIVSDFFKVVARELLLVLSTGVITFYTAPRLAFYISMGVGVTAILLKWLNSNSLSKIAFSCLCDGYGLNPMMYFFSFIGLFDIGCHPITKCSFVASRAFLFVKDGPNSFEGPNIQILDREKGLEEGDIEQGYNKFQGPYPFNGAVINLQEPFVEFLKQGDEFGLGLFQLSPKIDFIKRNHGKRILKSFMVLKLLGVNLCEYPVERLELPEDYSKANELYNFLTTLSLADGFVTDKMRGRYEHSLTLLEIVDGVEESSGYKIMKPMDAIFVVALCSNKP